MFWNFLKIFQTPPLVCPSQYAQSCNFGGVAHPNRYMWAIDFKYGMVIAQANS